MKVKIDTVKKIITLEEDINVGLLFDEIRTMFSDNWREYKILQPVQDTFTPNEPTVPFIQPLPDTNPGVPYNPWSPIMYKSYTDTEPRLEPVK